MNVYNDTHTQYFLRTFSCNRLMHRMLLLWSHAWSLVCLELYSSMADGTASVEWGGGGGGDSGR